MRILKTPGNSALGIVVGKEGTVKIYRPTTNLVPVCLLFLVVALTATPAFAAPRAEVLSHTRSVSERTVTSGPSDPEEMEAFLDSFFEAKMVELHIPGAAIVVVRDGAEGARSLAGTSSVTAWTSGPTSATCPRTLVSTST